MLMVQQTTLDKDILNSNQLELEGIISQLVGLDGTEYQVNTAYINRIKRNERTVRKLLRAGTTLPKDSDHYAALEPLRPRGNIRWKKLAHILKKKYNISDEEFNDLTENCRGEAPSKLIYGRVNDPNYLTAQQLPLFTAGQLS